MWFWFFWYVSAPCSCLADLPRCRLSASICVLPGHCSGLGRNELLRGQIGGLFFWKLGVLLLLLLLSVKVYRPFCQYLCPLGAIYGWFNRFSLVRIRWDEEKCISCMACQKACPVALSVQEISVSPECIRCGKCVEACPEGCLHFHRKPHPGRVS